MACSYAMDRNSRVTELLEMKDETTATDYCDGIIAKERSEQWTFDGARGNMSSKAG